MLKVAIVPDVPEWAADNIAVGVAANAPEGWQIERKFVGNIEGNINKQMKEKYDVIYFMFWHAAGKFVHQWKEYFPDSKLAVGIVGYAKVGSKEFFDVIQHENVKGVNCCCKKIYDLFYTKHRNFHLTHHGIDTNLFYPRKYNGDRFVIGWAGNALRPLKRVHLLKQLGFPILVQGRELHVIPGFNEKVYAWKNTRVKYNEMVGFYHSIDCYICLSDREGGPSPVYEAAACGLPVISTDVGIASEMLESEWVITETDEEKILYEAKKKLKILAEDKELRREIGQRNLKEIQQRWTLQAVEPEWTRFFKSVMEYE